MELPRSAPPITSPSNVEPEQLDAYRDKLIANGVDVTFVVNHSNSLEGGHKADYDPATDDGDVFIRSVYFRDPNGITLEFAAWTRSSTRATCATRLAPRRRR